MESSIVTRKKSLKKRILKAILTRAVKPYLNRYLSKERLFLYRKISIIVKPNVFHPGLFFSTVFLLDKIDNEPLFDKNALDLGSGTGIMAVRMCQKGSNVIAVDINPEAVQCTKENIKRNKVNVQAFQSDLFSALTGQIFDWVIINPPYYAKDPKNDAEHAWYCGSNHEYFTRLFHDMIDHTHEKSHIWMVLSEDCAIDTIKSIAKKYGWDMLVKAKRTNWGEETILFDIKRIKASA